MARKRHTPEEIVAKLRQVNVLVSQGPTVEDSGQHERRCRLAVGVVQKCHFQVALEIDRALMVNEFLVLSVTLI